VELEQYEARMMTEMDRAASLAWAEEKGVMRGEARGITIGSLRQAQAIARKMLADGFSIDAIEKYTGLSEPEILALE
jgi:predicted transposase/invertase (TIGR01784 family)